MSNNKTRTDIYSIHVPYTHVGKKNFKNLKTPLTGKFLPKTLRFLATLTGWE